MAITEVGTTQGTNAAAVTSFTIDVSALGLQKNDIVVVQIAQSFNASTTLTCSGDQSGAFQYVYATQTIVDSRYCNHRLAWQRMGATPDATLTIGKPSSTAYACAVRLIAFRGVDTVTALDVTAPTPTTGTNGNQANPPAITPSTAGAWVVAAYAGTTDTTPTNKTAPSDLTTYYQQTKAGTTSGIIAGLGYYSGWTSGSFDPAATTGGETAAQDSWGAGTIALRPRRSPFPQVIHLLKS